MKCLNGCGREAGQNSRGKKDFCSMECYQEFGRKNKGRADKLETLDIVSQDIKERNELLDWAKIGDRECLKILKEKFGILKFFDGGAIIDIEHARL